MTIDAFLLFTWQTPAIRRLRMSHIASPVKYCDQSVNPRRRHISQRRHVCLELGMIRRCWHGRRACYHRWVLDVLLWVEWALFQVPANHLLSASVMSAPAALAVSKLFYPETKKSNTTAEDVKNMEKRYDLFVMQM